MSRLSRYSSEQINALKDKCRRDLYFLGKEVLEKDFMELPHRAMCDFYVHKDPSYKRFRDFGIAYNGARDRMQLIPRKTYKSSIKVVDNAQWVICWPEIRIMTVTATRPLSTAFIDELIAYFTIRGKAYRNPDTNIIEGGRPTLFQELFIEHCLTEFEANSGEFVDPARNALPANMIAKEATAGVLSMDGSSSGWHCDIIDFDDPVSDRNAETGLQLEKLGARMAMIYELVEDYGFRHIAATRYHPLDPYGELAISHGITQLYGDFESEGLKYMCRPCWWIKGKPYEQPDYKSWVPSESEVELLFPAPKTFDALRKKMKNFPTFAGQQLNNPEQASRISFAEDLIRGCFRDVSALPRTGIKFASWDFSYGLADSEGDYSVGAVGLIDQDGRWWIIDIVREHFNFSEKCFQVVKMIGDHRPLRTCIEDNPGTKGSMHEPIGRYGRQLQIDTSSIDWVTTGRGTNDAKYLRICALHPFMTDNRFFILNNIKCADDLILEFKRVKSHCRARNDIPDALARMVQEYTRFNDQLRGPALPMNAADQLKEVAEREFHNLMFRQGKYAEGGDWDQGRYSADYKEPAVIEDALDPDSPSYEIDQLFKVPF